MRKVFLPLTIVLALLMCLSADAQFRLFKKKKFAPQPISGTVVIGDFGGGGGGGGGGTTCSADGGTVTISSSSGNGCPGSNSTTLSTSNSLGSLQWYSSTDNVNFDPIADATGSSYTATNLLVTSYFAVLATVSSTCTKWSNKVTVTIAVPTWYKDNDNDGYSDGNILTQCEQPEHYKAASELTSLTPDCNDDDATIYPGALEAYDGKDNNCDGQIDEGLLPPTLSSATTGYQDYTIPAGVSSIDLTVQGARGGSFKFQQMLHGEPFGSPGMVSVGGAAAQLKAKFKVETNCQQGLKPGGTLRLIIGATPSSITFTQQLTPSPAQKFAHGGGGGSAVLYKAPGSSEWVVLMVAGGGGGSIASFSGTSASGTAGIKATYKSSDPDSTGADGMGGRGLIITTNIKDGTRDGQTVTTTVSAGGGGAFGDAIGNCGGGKGLDADADGGVSAVCSGGTAGGFGFGAGGSGLVSTIPSSIAGEPGEVNASGGGGGGYSGGNGGQQGLPGFGGGSFTNAMAYNVFWKTVSVDDGAISITTTSGEGCCSAISLTYAVLDPLQLSGCGTGAIAATSFAYSASTVNLTAQQYAGIPFSIAQGSCDLSSVVYLDVIQSSTASSVVVLRTFTLTDINGKTATATQTITVTDDVDPTAIAKNVTVYLDANGNGTVAAADVNNGSSDNCTAAASLVLELSKTSFSCSDLGENNVALTVKDAAGNSSTANATVTVADNTPPIVKTQGKTIYLDANGVASITAADINNGSTDNCSIPAANYVLSKTSFDCSNLGPNTVTLTVTDGSTNSNSGTAVVTVVDNLKPTVVTKNINVDLDVNGHATITDDQVNNGSSDNCTADANLVFQTDIKSFNCSDIGSPVTVTLKVTDGSSNFDTKTATVTVRDLLNPTAVTEGITVQLDASGHISITPAQVNNGSSDNCTGATSLQLSLDKTDFDCSNIGTNTVTLTVKDASGNSSSETAIVTVEDKLAPNVVTKDITIYLDANGQANIADNAVDNGSSDNCTSSSNLVFSTNIKSFNCSNTAAPVPVVLTVTDAKGNWATGSAMVTVVDNTAPTVITQDVTIYLNASGQATVTAAQVNKGSTDNCSIPADGYSLSKTSFDCSNVGQNAVILTVTDASGNSNNATASIMVVDNTNPTAVCKNITVNLGTDGQVSISAADVNNGSYDNCSIASLSIDKSTFTSAEIGSACEKEFPVVLTVTDASGNTATCTSTVTVKKRVTKLVYNGATEGQFSDPVNVSATLYDITNGEPGVAVANKTVGFTLGSQFVSDIYGGTGAGTDANGVATGTFVLNQSPVPTYTVVSSFAGDAVYCASSATQAFDIKPEDICAEYNGQLSIAATVLSKTSNSAKVVMSVGLNESADGSAGDVTKAIVEFNYNGSWIAVPVQALNTEKTNGNASLVATISFSGDASTLNFAYRISGYYQINPDCSDDGQAIINVYKPQGEFITGGGTIVPTKSSGSLPSDAGRKSNFGFNVKYNQKNTNLQGNISYLFRRKENGVVHIYQVKGNSMTSLTVNISDATEGGAKTAVFTGKCNITDVTDPLLPVSVSGTGNGIMQVIITDGGDLGTTDKYGITVWSSGNQLLHSSNWELTKTTKLPLSGGNVVVSSTTTSSTAMAPALRNDAESRQKLLYVPLEVQVFGNPSSYAFSLMVKGGSQERIRMKVTDVNGRIVEERNVINKDQVLSIGSSYTQGAYFVEVLQGNQRKLVKLIKL